MKDQYVGDVNDYLKYALLRSLAPSRDLTVAWMLTQGDDRSDGQRLGYLAQPEKYRRLDPVLYDTLGALVRRGDRRATAIERSSILVDAAFIPNLLGDDLTSRRQYFEKVRRVAANRRILFFDPDNGLAVASVTKGRRGSSKYVYWDEAAATYARGHSLVVYQHLPRRPRTDFLREVAERVFELTLCQRMIAVVTSYVAFLVVPQPAHETELVSRLADFSVRAAPHATTVVSVRT